jgi:hypothetical protein
MRDSHLVVLSGGDVTGLSLGVPVGVAVVVGEP